MKVKTYFETLKAYLKDNPPNYGDGDAHAVLEMLYTHYNEFNGMDTEEIKKDFEELYQRMTGMPLREMDRIIDTVCSLCRNHEKAGFVEGIKIGIRLQSELMED